MQKASPRRPVSLYKLLLLAVLVTILSILNAPSAEGAHLYTKTKIFNSFLKLAITAQAFSKDQLV